LLSSSLRSGPGGPSSRREHPDRRGPGPGFGERGSQPPLDEEFRPPPADMPSSGNRMPFGPRRVQLTPQLSSFFDPSQIDPFYFVIWSRNGELLQNSTNAPAEITLPERANPRDTRTYTRTRGAFREAFHYTELGDCILAGRSTAGVSGAIARFRWSILAAGGALLAFGLGGGWWLTSRAIRPIEDISAAATRISEGNLSERIANVDAHNEIGRLAAVLNSTFARLEAAFAEQKQFTADASHELRTPLTVLITEMQIA